MSNEMAALDPNSVKAKKQTIDASKKLRFGIIGTGWVAGWHMNELKRMPDVDIVAGADIIPGKAEEFFKGFGIEGVHCYTDCKTMLAKEKLDAVSICTYNSQHAPCAIEALIAGVNVLLEKPMCVTLEEAADIVRAEKKSGKILSIGFQPRFDPNMKMIQKIVQSGELGEVYYIQTGGGRRRGIPTPFGTSFIEKETGGIGALGDIGCYSLDLVLNALSYPKPLTVSGYKSAFFGTDPAYFLAENKPASYAKLFGVDDFAAAFIRLEGGIILDFRIAWAMHLDTPGDTIFMGKKGSLRVPSTNCWNGSPGGAMKVYKDIGGLPVETEIPVIGPEPNAPRLPEDGLFYQKIRSFLDVCKNGGAAPVPSSQILYNQAILDGIVKSAELGREIEIQIPQV